ncbi:very large A-kinase anchor protein isoform X2 [Trichosurus vulpecula]|uniref:very large A-kinase anchor protein isoform X2 n=1 Tax=Trichosurus vulpecula TaxID=9337 RepID=UPI00186B3694|nr:very large A-kinase anchor protein isoform X2 [Trichosurus vulpecula]
MSGGGRRRAGSSWPSFSRFFALRSTSRDEEEEKPAATQPQAGGAPSPENGPVTISQKTENTSSTEPVKISRSEDSRSHSEKSANLSPEDDSKQPDSFPGLPSDAKTVDSDKQPKEGFFQFLGNLFNISAKSPQQPTLKREHDKTEKDSHNLLVLHEEEFKKESDICSSLPLEKPSPATEEKDLPTSIDLSDAISEDITQDSEQESNEFLKKIEGEPEISSITYSTYRGPRQILKILKKQTKLETSTSVQITDETSDSSASTQTGTGSESEAFISPDSPIKNNADLLKDPLKDAVLNNSNYKESILNRPSSSTETISSPIVESCYNHPLNCVPVYRTDNDMLGSVLFENDTKDPRNPAFQGIVNPKTTLENNFFKNDKASEQRGEHFQPPSIVLSDLNVGLTNKESETVKHENLPSPSKTTLHDELGLLESKCSLSYHFGNIVHHRQAETDTEHMNEENKSVIQDSQINMQVKENTKEKEISSGRALLSSANILHAKNEVVGSLLKDTDYSLATKNKSFDFGPSDKVSQGIIIIQNDHPSIKFVNESEKVDCIQNSITPELKLEVVNRNHISVPSFESENLELAKVLPGSSDVNNEKTSPILESEKADFYDSASTFDFEGDSFRKWEAPVLKNRSPSIEHERDRIVHSTTLKEINLVLPDMGSEEIYEAEIFPSESKFKDKHLKVTSQSYCRSQNETPVVLESGVAEDLLHGHDSKVIGSVTYDENKISLGPHEPRDTDATKIFGKSGIRLSSSDILPKSQDDGTLQFLGSDISMAKITSKLKAKSSLEVSAMLRAEETASFQRHYEKNNLLGDSSTSKPEEANMLINSSKPKDNFEISKVTTELTHEDNPLVVMLSTNSCLWEFEKANQTVAEMTLCHKHGKDVPKIHIGKGGPNYLTAAVLKNAMEADAQTVGSTTVSVNSSSQQCSEASAEDTGIRKRAHDTPLVSNSDLVKTAEKLVDIILDSVRQELKSTHIGINYKDCNAVTLKEESTGKKTSEEKEKTLIQLPDHLDECSVEDVSEDKREEKACDLTTVGERNLLIDTNRMDVSNLLIIKARELVSEVIHGAQQKLIDGRYRKTKPRNHNRSTVMANATKILNNDIVKPHYIAKGFLASEQPESQSITKLSKNKESESLLAKINLNNDTDSTKGREIVPYQKTLYAGNGFEQSDNVELPNSDVLISENISLKDLDDKGMPLTCNKEESEAQKAPSQTESVGSHKTQTEDTGTLVLNFEWPPFMNDEVYTHLPSTSKSSFSDSLVCINEKCLPGHSNKSLPIAVLEMGKVYRKDAEFNIGKIEMAPPMLEMGKVYKKSTELNVGKNELMPSMLKTGKMCKMHAQLNAGENELMPSVLEVGKSYGRSELNITKLQGTPDNFKMGKPFKRNTDEMTPVMIELEKAFEKDVEGNVGKTTMTSAKLKTEKTCKDDIQLNVTQADTAKPTILEIAKMNQKTAEWNIEESKAIPAMFEVEKVYQMDTEENFGKTEMRPIETKKSVVLCDNKAMSQFEGYELPMLNKDCEGNIDLMTPDFLPEDSKLRTEKNLCMTAMCGKERGLDYDIANEQSRLAFMPQDEQGNSSFTILYEEPLQDEGRYLSAKEGGTHSLVFPEESTNGLPHVLVCERSESRTDLVHHFEKESKSGEIFDTDNSEMFLSVEAKRYKVYPLALSPIYEDDSSQEDILSGEVSPGHRGSSAKSRDGASQPSSVLSLLQSVSERLRMNFDDAEKLETEEVVDEDEEGPQHKEIILKTGKKEHVTYQLPDCSTTVYQGEDQEGTRSSKMPLFLSNEPTTSNQQTVLWQDRSLLYHTPGPFLQKSDLSSKLHSSFKSVYNQYLQTTKTLSPEKGHKFGGNLQEPVPKLSTCPENPIDKQSLRSNPRPGKMVIYDLHGSKYKQEIYNNILDATSWTFPNGAFIRVVRGCWILYEKPHFQGRKSVLEEGEKVLNRDWIFRSKKHQTRNFVIGSIKRVLKDCSVPEIELCPQSDAACCPIYLQRSVGNLEELNLPRSVSFSVKAGVWLAFPDVNFKGQVTVLEEGHGLFEISASEMKSLHPLQMGGLKVEMPMNLRVIIYDKTHFLGQAKEFNEHVDSVPELFRNENFFGIASIRVIGGVWVAYEKEHFKGQQYLLEEGEYEDISTWETLNSTLMSFRYLQANFIESSVTLFESDVENSKFVNIINRDVPDLKEVGFGNETRSIHVKSGVWVGYRQRFFCGEQYILEKGKYKSFFDWGGSNNQLMSIRPVRLEPLGINEPPYLDLQWSVPRISTWTCAV